MEKYFKDMDYEKISEEEAFNGRRVKVKIEKYYNKRDNKEVYREHIKAGNGAVIMPFLDNNTLIMIEEIRTPIGKSILAFPAGLIEKGEEPADAAKRELEEETGYRAGEIEQIIYEYPAVGYSYIFVLFSACYPFCALLGSSLHWRSYFLLSLLMYYYLKKAL